MQKKIFRSSYAFVGIALLGLVSVGWCQSGAFKSQTNQDPETEKKMHSDFDRLVERQSKLISQAKKQVFLKHYAYAEQLCQEATELMADAPFAQAPSKQELAEVYLAEGMYKGALKIWEPMFHPQDPETQICCGLATAYARLGETDKGAEVLRPYFKVYQIDFKFLSGGGSPMDEEVRPETVEATAILMSVHLHASQFAGVDEAALQRALALAPKNGCVLWKLGEYYFYGHGGWTRAKPYYAAAYRHGSKIIKEYSAGRFQSQGQPLPYEVPGRTASVP